MFYIALTVDFDGQSVWLAKGLESDASYLARGEYCAEVGAPRLLLELKHRGLTSSWGVPVHTLNTWPDVVEQVLSDGHEVFAHGVCHESLKDLPAYKEEALLSCQVETFKTKLGISLEGYRAPSGPVTYNTMPLLEKYGFRWDSSLGGRDFEPYHPRAVRRISSEGGTQYGHSYQIVEFSPSWYQEDWFAFEFVPGSGSGLGDPSVVLRRWMDSITWGIANIDEGVFVLTLHPQCIGRSHHMVMLGQFLDWCESRSDVYIGSARDILGRLQIE